MCTSLNKNLIQSDSNIVIKAYCHLKGSFCGWHFIQIRKLLPLHCDLQFSFIGRFSSCNHIEMSDTKPIKVKQQKSYQP
jgi:hypothetical protein